MSLIIEHRFPLGRFHATRWKQSPYEDSYGEWPPSPWRLLRALAARWFQYSRETGDNDELKRDVLLNKLSSSLPTFVLPPLSFYSSAIMQYQPTGIEWTDKSKIAAGYKKAQTTKAKDHYRALPCDESIYWIWDNLKLNTFEIALLDKLLERLLFFGRSESFSHLRRVDRLPEGVTPNCHLAEQGTEAMSPVLVPMPGNKLNIEALLAATDDKKHLKGRPVPPGTTWFYAKLPERPLITIQSPTHNCYSSGLNCIQFTVGGHVYPPLNRWVKITERFRGHVIRCLAQNISPGSNGRYERLTLEEKNSLALITGKDGQGHPLRGHMHAFFILWPDAHGLPTRLVVWRDKAFTEYEIEALLKAAEKPLAWDNNTENWKLRIIPLPFDTPLPVGLLSESKVWVSATPFVPPANRHRFRRNGRLRSGESIECILSRLLRQEHKPEPETIELFDGNRAQSWLSLHESRKRRFSKVDGRTPLVRPGFRLRIEFPSLIHGPMILGDSSHFGLGLFIPDGNARL